METAEVKRYVYENPYAQIRQMRIHVPLFTAGFNMEVYTETLEKRFRYYADTPGPDQPTAPQTVRFQHTELRGECAIHLAIAC